MPLTNVAIVYQYCDLLTPVEHIISRHFFYALTCLCSPQMSN